MDETTMDTTTELAVAPETVEGDTGGIFAARAAAATRAEAATLARTGAADLGLRLEILKLAIGANPAGDTLATADTYWNWMTKND